MPVSIDEALKQIEGDAELLFFLESRPNVMATLRMAAIEAQRYASVEEAVIGMRNTKLPALLIQVFEAGTILQDVAIKAHALMDTMPVEDTAETGDRPDVIN